MINYSIALRGNPIKPEEPKKAYAVAQCTSVLPLDKFAGHISSRKVQAKVLKAVKSGETTVDLTEESTDTDSGSTDSGSTDDSGSDSGDNPLV